MSGDGWRGGTRRRGMGLIAVWQQWTGNQSKVDIRVAPALLELGRACGCVAALVPPPIRCPGAGRCWRKCSDNPASARVLTNCGFEYLGDAKPSRSARHAKVATWT